MNDNVKPAPMTLRERAAAIAARAVLKGLPYRLSVAEQFNLMAALENEVFHELRGESGQ